jgi:hypothetical protein
MIGEVILKKVRIIGVCQEAGSPDIHGLENYYLYVQSVAFNNKRVTLQACNPVAGHRVKDCHDHTVSSFQTVNNTFRNWCR